ncbi:MAG: amidohydrolase family protein [Verrucomicrobiales bacterium]
MHALVGGRVVMRPGEVLDRATVIVREGIVTAVGESVAVPADARMWNLEGQTIYSGFIDGATSAFDDGSEFDASHWNPKVRPERRMADALKSDSALREKWRALGFTAAGAMPGSGIFRGSGCVLQLGDGPLRSNVLKEDTGHYAAFETGRGYPSSLMGSIALIRQVLIDAKWDGDYRRVFEGNPFGLSRPEDNAALQALAGVTRSESNLVFAAGDELDFERALRIGEEAGLRIYFLGNGYEYRKLQSLAGARSQLFLPIAFPGKPPVADPDVALDVSLEQLQHWESAPGNPAALEEAGISFALSTMGHNDGNGFWKHVREAVGHGLDPDAALAALTTRPASMLGIDRLVGEISTGRIANFSIYTGDPFSSEKAELYQIWIDGKCYPMPAALQFDPVGTWAFQWGELDGPKQGKLTGKWPDFVLEFEDPGEQPEKPKEESKPLKLKAKAAGNRLVLSVDEKTKGVFAGFNESVPVQLAAHYADGRLSGIAQMPDGRTVSWFGTQEGDSKREDESPIDDSPSDDDKSSSGPARLAQYPAGAFGVKGDSLVAPESILIKGATVWPCDGSKPVDDADVLMRGGKIVRIGRDIAAEVSHVIDGHGKHVTPGLLDAHSHIAISRGVNEGTHAVTIEVRIGDVIDPTDISIYRQLAGGLTTANILHGSANPMGGQNQVIKLRWGKGAEGLKFAGAKPGVKFALGENVKQSNWRNATTRYPQTRMGVEQVMKDTFLAARNYEKQRASGSRVPFRRDLRMDAALEILNGERIVHIHSYRQDEILMFVRLAEQFNFTVATFQHVLEGYKVADAIAGIQAGGSSFSDWWAYKFEVYDAIPFNGAIMHNAGVLTSFNSDDAELGRRMNAEAAKAVKYGGVPEELALQFVTLNSAKQLRIDDHVGSLEVGKDADFVIWSGHPLSTYSRAEQTWIDGIRYFSLEDDAALRNANATERQRLIGKALATPDKKQDDKAESDNAKDDKVEPSLSLAERWKRMTGGALELYQEELEYRPIYHNGENLHTCSGDSCSACRQ